MRHNVPPKHLLVPVDFSEPSRMAASYAAKIAVPLGADLTLLHAITSMEEVEVLLSEQETPIDWGTARADAANVADKMLQAVAVAIGHPDAVRLVVDGHAAPATAEAAREHEMDMVVVGSHGRTGLRRALLGSVAERMARLCPVPVLVVHWAAEP